MRIISNFNLLPPNTTSVTVSQPRPHLSPRHSVHHFDGVFISLFQTRYRNLEPSHLFLPRTSPPTELQPHILSTDLDY